MAKKKTLAKKKKKKRGGPIDCPQWVISDDGYEKLYYADYYPDSDDCSTVQAAYVYGNYPFPCACGQQYGCFEFGRGARDFPGLRRPIDIDEDYQAPSLTLDYTNWSHFDALPFVSFKVGSTYVYAKVFRLCAHVQDFPGKPPKPNHPVTTMFIALECAPTPDDFTVIDPADVTALPRRGGPNGHAFQLKYVYPAGGTIKTIYILALRS